MRTQLGAFAARTDDPEQAVAARALAGEHRAAHRDGYRGQLGFTYLILTA